MVATEPRLGSQEWIDEAFRALAKGGVDAVRVELLATALQVTKGSFYWHFKNRRSLLDALLETWESRGTEQVIKFVDATSTDPEQQLRALISFAMGVPDIEAAIDAKFRAWASIDTEAAAAIQRVDARRIEYATGLLTHMGCDETDAVHRAGTFYRILVGEYTWRTAGHGAATPEQVEAITTLLLRGI